MECKCIKEPSNMRLQKKFQYTIVKAHLFCYNVCRSNDLLCKQ